VSKFQEFCSGHNLTPIECKGMKYVFERISKSMSWDEDKTILWLDTENPLLGGATPIRLAESGRIHKLVKFVESCLEDNYST
jgi:hypothetical protein